MCFFKKKKKRKPKEPCIIYCSLRALITDRESQRGREKFEGLYTETKTSLKTLSVVFNFVLLFLAVKCDLGLQLGVFLLND